MNAADLARMLSALRARIQGDLALVADIERAVLGAELGEGGQRPRQPTRGYCCLPPNRVRWTGEVEVQQRLWHLLGCLLDGGEAVPFGDIEDVVYPGRGRDDRRIQKDVSALNLALLPVRFPWVYRTKSGLILRD